MRRSWILLPLLLLAAGCVSVDYTGRKFTPVPTMRVKVYQSSSEVPADKYAVIGHFTATCPPDVHPFEVEYEVQSRGAKYGGDAICLVKEYSRPHSAYNSEIEEFGSPDRSKRKIPKEEKARFGSPAPLAGDTKWKTRHVRQYVLLKDRETVRRELSL